MNRRQSLDKPAILSPPVQFIVPSPTASASPSPRLLQNCSPNTAAVTLSHHHHHQLQQQSPQQQHRNLLSDVVLVTNPHDITARRLSTGSNPATAAAAGGTILLRQSPSQSPSHNIIFTNGPTTPVSSTPTTPTGHEFNTTLVGSNNIALNVKRGSSSGGGGATIFSGLNATTYNSIGQGAGITNRRGSHVQHSNHGGGGGGSGGGSGGGGASPRPGKRPVSLTQSSPVPSPMASPTTLKQNTPNQSPIHHQIPILTSHTGTGGGQPMYQLIQTSAGTQQLIQTAGPNVSPATATTTVHHQQQQQQQHLQHHRQVGAATAMPVTFNAPAAATLIQANQPQPPPLHQVKVTKGPQQILPKPATGIGTPTNATKNATATTAKVTSSTTTQSSSNSVPNGLQQNGPVPMSTATILTTNTNPAMSQAPPPASNPILLPTAQPHQLIMSANQMPMLVQQNTPQGVQFILRQPTNQLTTGPLMLAGAATGARGQPTLQAGQPQQLLRIVNGNGQVQFSPATTTFIMSSQGNLIQQLQAAPTTTQPGTTQQQQHQQHQQHQHQMKAATEIQQKLNPIQLGQTINGNLVQMSTGQFISQFPAQNFNFANVNQLVAAPNVTFATGSNGGGGAGSVDNNQQQGGGGGATIQFNNVMQPPIQIHHQQQIISPIASPALATHHQHHQQGQGQTVTMTSSQSMQDQGAGQMVILQQSPGMAGTAKKVVVTPPPPQQSHHIVTTPSKAKKERKETRKEKATKAQSVTKKSPVIARPSITPPPPPPPVPVAQVPAVEVAPAPPTKGKLDLANVMMLCGIGLDDDDDDEDCGEMLMDQEYQPPPPLQMDPSGQGEMMQVVDEQEQQQQQQEGVVAMEKGMSGDIMITIPGVNSSESIPISFSIAAGVGEMVTSSGKGQANRGSTEEVIALDDSWSPQKMHQSVSEASLMTNRILDDTMCVDTFVNSVLDSQMTPTLQSQIAEIQNQLLGVTQESGSSDTTGKAAVAATQIVVENKTAVVGQGKSQVNSLKKTVAPPVATVRAKPTKKQNGSKDTSANNRKQSAAKISKESPKGHVQGVAKAVTTTTTMPMTMPSQIGNIQISQVDSSSVKAPQSKVATSIDNQIQITPILDGKVQSATMTTMAGTTMTTSSGSSFGTPPVSSNMTVTMKTVAVNHQPQHQVTAMPKLQPTMPSVMMTRPQQVVQQNAVMPSVQINLQAPNQHHHHHQPALAMAMQQQQHPLLSQLTGALTLNLMDDGRLVLKHDASAPQDAQSQMILQTILSGALPNLTLINETKQQQQQQQQQQQPQIAMENKPNLMVQQKMGQVPVMQQQTIVRKAVVEPQPQNPAPQQQQHVLMNASQGNIVELPKIGPDKQLFKMNMATNQITQISAGSTTALVKPMEQLLIVPADINPQQLAQCQAAGQLQLHNMGNLKPSQPPGLVQQQQQTISQQPQPPPLQTQLKPQSVMPGLVNSATGAPVKNVVAPTQSVGNNNNKKGKKKEVVHKVTTAKVVPSQVHKQQQQQQQVVVQQQQQSKPPILKNNTTVSKIKVDGVNTAVVRPNTIQNHATVKPHTITLPAAGNKITITAGGQSQQQQQQQQQPPLTAIMQNLQKNTQIVLPSSIQQQQKAVMPQVQQQQQQQQQPQPRVQTIQLTPQNQQMLKEVQLKIQILSGKLKDKNLLETLTFPIELDESNPINRQPLPTLQNCNTMTDKDIHVALQRLFIEQQKILATGKVIPTISNYSQQQQQQPQPSNVMQVPPMTKGKPSSISGGGNSVGAAEMVKNWPLMKTQQINEMTIKPIIASSSSAGGPPFPLPSKVINSTTIIPAPVSGTMTLGGGVMTSQVAGTPTTIVINKMGPGESATSSSGTMSITPVVVPAANAGGGGGGVQQKGHKQAFQQGQVQNTAVISGVRDQGVVNKTQMMAPGLISIGSGNTATGVKHQPLIQVKVEPKGIKVEEPVMIIKEEVVEHQQQQQPKGKSAKELAEITKRFEGRIKYDQECCTQPDTETPFRGKRDAVMRLMGYHCNYREHEPEYPEEEVRFQEAAVTVQEGLWSLRQRFQTLLMNGSMLNVATSERVMVERHLKSELEQEIVDLKADIERLNNPEPEPEPEPEPLPPPPPTQQVKEEHRLPAELLFKPITSTPFNSLCNNISGLSQGLLEDETTRTSDATDSRSMCEDVKSESGPFGWHDDWTEDEEGENSSSLARLNHHQQQKKEVKVKEEVVVVSSHRNSSFDIESEILPNFILNMKKGDSDREQQVKVESRRAPSPVSSVKSEGYDEWTSIQKELASMGATDVLGESAKDTVKPEKHRFDVFDKLKKPWMAAGEGELQQTTTEVNSGRLGSTSMAPSGHHQSAKQNVAPGNSFFSLESSNHSEAESWLDFQHNNNSFDFPIAAPAGSAGHHQQLMNGTHNPNGGGAAAVASSVNHLGQKRVWNGLPSSHGNGSSNGATGGGLLNGGGGDDFYAKKMCYGNGDFDFNHLMMGGNSQPGTQQNQSHHQQQQQSSYHSGSNGGMGVGMEQTHSQNFDEDINRQVQSAIDSILNLHGSDATDFHFNLDPAMGALLGGGDSSSGHGAGGGLLGSHHPNNVNHQLSLINGGGGGEGLSRNSSPLLTGSRFSLGHHGVSGQHSSSSNSQAMLGHQQQQQLHLTNNSHHHHHNQSHQHHQDGGQSSLASAMMLSDDEDEDEQQRAIKSVLLS